MALTPAVVIVIILVAAVVVVSGGQLLGTRSDSTDLADSAPAGSALAALGQLPVKGHAPRTGYSREQFGQAWSDVDHDGCDTRDDILARDLHQVRTRADDPCVVTSGVLDDPYQPKVIHFRRGPDSAAVQIDHVVPLSNAWQTGAQQWSATTRLALANDPLNLLAVDGPLNEAKSDSDAATWLPPNKAFRCTYVARQVAVKAKYRAWVTAAEREAIATVLSSCPDQPLPNGQERRRARGGHRAWGEHREGAGTEWPGADPERESTRSDDACSDRQLRQLRRRACRGSRAAAPQRPRLLPTPRW